jgi:hypothetical protein
MITGISVLSVSFAGRPRLAAPCVQPQFGLTPLGGRAARDQKATQRLEATQQGRVSGAVGRSGQSQNSDYVELSKRNRIGLKLSLNFRSARALAWSHIRP